MGFTVKINSLKYKRLRDGRYTCKITAWSQFNKKYNKKGERFYTGFDLVLTSWTVLLMFFTTTRTKYLNYRGSRVNHKRKVFKNFKFPVSEEFSSEWRPAWREINKFIHECITACLKAQQGVSLDTETLRMGAQMICNRVQVLRDPKSWGFPKDNMFP